MVRGGSTNIVFINPLTHSFILSSECVPVSVSVVDCLYNQIYEVDMVSSPMSLKRCVSVLYLLTAGIFYQFLIHLTKGFLVLE